MTISDKTEFKQDMYPIRTVVSLTGVQAVTLRAWERRYGLISPMRTETGHRLYSREDVGKIRKASELLESGMNISQAARILNNPDLARLDPTNSSMAWAAFQQRILDAIYSFDELLLEEIYQQALSLHPIQTVTQELIIPVLRALGDRWDKIATGIAAEHFFSVFLRNKLGARFHHRSRTNNGPKLICACLPGDPHEIGLLLFSLAADDANYRQILLGADMPLPHLAEAAKRTSVNAIVLSGKYLRNPVQVIQEIETLVTASPVPVFVGGEAADRMEKEINTTGAIYAGSLIENGIQILNQYLKSKRTLRTGL